MSRKSYTRELREKVVREAIQPENERMEYIIVESYGVMPWIIRKQKENHLEFRAKTFGNGLLLSPRKCPAKSSQKTKMQNFGRKG